MKLCSVCLSDISLPRRSKDINPEGSLFSTQLSIFYFVHKLLEIPLDECEKYLTKYGNPRDWVVLCTSCSSVLQEAENIHSKIVQLQNDLESLKNKLAMQMRVKIEEDNDDFEQNDTATATKEIRKFVAANRELDIDEFLPAFKVSLQDQDDMEMEEGDQLSQDSFEYDQEPIESHAVDLVGLELENSLWDGKVWKCPVCDKKYAAKRIWRDHIRRKHRPFLLHLDDKVPADHVCKAGLCIPGCTCKWGQKKNVKSRDLENEKYFSAQEDQGIIESQAVRLSGLELENSLRDGDVWNCPVCDKKYTTKRIWRDHIRRKHRPFLLHLDDKVPTGHICKGGLCIPGCTCNKSRKYVKKNRRLKTEVVNDVVCTSSASSDDECEPVVKILAKRTATLGKKSMNAEDEYELAESAISDTEWRPTDDEEEDEEELKKSDSSDEEYSLSTNKKTRTAVKNENNDGSKRKCHLCFEIFDSRNHLTMHFRKKHDLKLSTLPALERKIILARSKRLIEEELDDVTENESCNNLKWKCHLCPIYSDTRKNLMNHFRNCHNIKFSTLTKEEQDEILSFNKDTLQAEVSGIPITDKPMLPSVGSYDCPTISHSIDEGSGGSTPEFVRISDDVKDKKATAVKIDVFEENKADCTVTKSNSNRKLNLKCSKCQARYKFSNCLSKHMLEAHGIASSDDNIFKTELFKDPMEGQLRVISVTKEKKDWATVCKEREEMLQSEELSISESLPPEIITKRKNARKRLQLYILAEKYRITNFPCDVCKKCFPSFSGWQNHTLTAHKTGFKCDTCGVIVGNPLNLENHIRTMHRPASILTCVQCQKVIKKIDRFNNHLRKNPLCMQKSIPCKVKSCKKRYSSREALDVHIQVRHDNPKLPTTPFKCSVCDKSTFSSQRALSVHEATHSLSKDYVCEKCGKSFYYNYRLQQHLRDFHYRTQKYKCKFCGSLLATQRYLRRHELLHEPENPYKCSICGKCFKIRDYLLIHMWSHDPDRHEKYSLYKRKPKCESISASRRARSKNKRKRVDQRVLENNDEVMTDDDDNYEETLNEYQNYETSSCKRRKPEIADSQNSGTKYSVAPTLVTDIPESYHQNTTSDQQSYGVDPLEYSMSDMGFR